MTKWALAGPLMRPAAIPKPKRCLTMKARVVFDAYSVGLVYASVCTSLTDEEATARLNQEYPTGIRSQWYPSDDHTFATGQLNPCPCPDTNSHRHILFNC